MPVGALGPIWKRRSCNEVKPGHVYEVIILATEEEADMNVTVDLKYPQITERYSLQVAC